MRLPVVKPSTAHENYRPLLSRMRIRDLAIGGFVAFSLILAIYVSIPDFPSREKAWQIELWNDPSGWWSELTWIIGFGAFASLSLLFRSWFFSLKPEAEIIKKFQLAVLTTVASWFVISISFLLYFRPVWSNFYSYFMLDSTGVLHGLFYVSTAHLGVLATVSGLALVGRVVGIVARKA